MTRHSSKIDLVGHGKTLNSGMATREQNERKFGQWQELAHGGRVYWLMVAGRHGWTAKYLKEVGAEENTVRFWQEIYNEQGALVEIHEKFPLDRGHQGV